LRVDVDAPVLLKADTAVLRLLGQMRRDMPTLYGQVSLIQRVGRDELEMRLRGVTVLAMTSVTLRRLADLEPVEADLARRQTRVSEIDLRYRDQVIARLQ
jgi:cell division septal protein FtsQ